MTSKGPPNPDDYPTLDPTEVVDEITSEPFTITPDVATHLLVYNTINRDIAQADVDNFAYVMKHDKWDLNGEAIILSDENPPEVLDGQHRLYACEKAGKPFVTVVTRGIKKATFKTIDTGRKRSAADVITSHAKMTGDEMKYPKSLAAAAKMCIEYQRGIIRSKGGHSHNKITHDEVLEYTLTHPGLGVWLERARHKKTWFTSYCAGLVAVCYLGGKKYEMKAHAFMHGCITGENLAEGSPINALRDRLSKEKNMVKAERMALMIHSWNKHVKDEAITILKLPRGAEIPVIAGTEKEKKVTPKAGTPAAGTPAKRGPGRPKKTVTK